MNSIRKLSYNWGYDPCSVFLYPKALIALMLSDPFSRLNEARMMVSAFHNEGIRIVMDVVYQSRL
jgi:pullulanase